MNLDKREQEFKDWLMNYLDQDEKTAHNCIQTLRNLVRNKGKNLDRAYKNDKLKKLLEDCKYTQDDYRNGKKPTIELDYYKPSVVEHHKLFLDALADYYVFCEKHPPK